MLEYATGLSTDVNNMANMGTESPLLVNWSINVNNRRFRLIEQNRWRFDICLESKLDRELTCITYANTSVCSNNGRILSGPLKFLTFKGLPVSTDFSNTLVPN